MTTKVVPGKLVAATDAEHVAAEAAGRLAKALRSAITMDGRATIALSGGSTPKRTYSLLAKDASLEWKKIDVFFVDDCAVPPSHERSNYRMVKETLLDPAKVPEQNVHRMQGEAKDLEKAAADYDAILRREIAADGEEDIPSFDAMVLGIGDDGHTASLFPHEPEVDVTDKLVTAVPAKGNREARLSLTVPVIEHAKAVFILATGAEKAPALERTWSIEGNIKDTPARLIRGVRGAVTWIIDCAAGGITG